MPSSDYRISWIEEDLTRLEIKANLKWEPEYRIGANKVWGEKITIYFNNQEDLLFYKLMGDFKEDDEHLVFDIDSTQSI